MCSCTYVVSVCWLFFCTLSGNDAPDPLFTPSNDNLLFSVLVPPLWRLRPVCTPFYPYHWRLLLIPPLFPVSGDYTLHFLSSLSLTITPLSFFLSLRITLYILSLSSITKDYSLYHHIWSSLSSITQDYSLYPLFPITKHYPYTSLFPITKD